MSDASKPASSVNWGHSLWIAIIIFVVYALSPGPVIKVIKVTGNNPPAAVEQFYAPLEFLSDNVRPVGDFYDGYFKLLGIE